MTSKQETRRARRQERRARRKEKIGMWLARHRGAIRRAVRVVVGLAAEVHQLAEERRRLLAVLLERPPVKVLGDREALASYHRIGRQIFGARWRPHLTSRRNAAIAVARQCSAHQSRCSS